MSEHWCAACQGTGKVYEVSLGMVLSVECSVCSGAGDMDMTACVTPQATTVMKHEWLPTGTASHVCRRCSRASVSIRSGELEELM